MAARCGAGDQRVPRLGGDGQGKVEGLQADVLEEGPARAVLLDHLLDVARPHQPAPRADQQAGRLCAEGETCHASGVESPDVGAACEYFAHDEGLVVSDEDDLLARFRCTHGSKANKTEFQVQAAGTVNRRAS